MVETENIVAKNDYPTHLGKYGYCIDIFSLLEKHPQIYSPNYSIVLVGIALICYGEEAKDKGPGFRTVPT